MLHVRRQKKNRTSHIYSASLHYIATSQCKRKMCSIIFLTKIHEVFTMTWNFHSRIIGKGKIIQWLYENVTYHTLAAVLLRSKETTHSCLGKSRRAFWRSGHLHWEWKKSDGERSISKHAGIDNRHKEAMEDSSKCRPFVWLDSRCVFRWGGGREERKNRKIGSPELPSCQQVWVLTCRQWWLIWGF